MIFWKCKTEKIEKRQQQLGIFKTFVQQTGLTKRTFVQNRKQHWMMCFADKITLIKSDASTEDDVSIWVSLTFAFFFCNKNSLQAELCRKTSFRCINLRLCSCCSDHLSLDTSGSRNIQNWTAMIWARRRSKVYRQSTLETMQSI